MQTPFTTALIIALATAFILAAVTCQNTKSRGDIRTKEAQENAVKWESIARMYAEALERAEEANRRAEQSIKDYMQDLESSKGICDDARKQVEEMRQNDDDAVWLNDHLPDRVRDILQTIHSRTNSY